MEIENRREPPKRSTSKQIWIALTSFVTSIAPSMSLGFSAIALPPLLKEDNPYKINEDQASWIASVASIATFIGCLISGPIADKWGRTIALHNISTVSLIGWIIIATSYYVPDHQYSLLLLGRLGTGFSTGLASMVSAFYVAEIASLELRPVLTGGSTTFYGLGVWTVFILGFIFQDNWGGVSIVAAVISGVSLLLTILFLPETPQWLVSKNRIEDAMKTMCKIYGFKPTLNEQLNGDMDAVVEQDIQKIIDNKLANKIYRNERDNDDQMPKTQKMLKTVKKQMMYFVQPNCWRPFIMITFYFFFSQFSGSFVIFFYAISIVKESEITTDSYIVIVLLASVRLIGTALMSFISRKVGRRPLSLTSGVGMAASMLVLATILVLRKDDTITQIQMIKLQYLSLTCLFGYVFFSSIGYLTLPFAINAEIFPVKLRGTATGLTACLAYFFNFIIVKVYPDMLGSMMNYGVFYFYGAISGLGVAYIFWFLPETKGKSFQEIEDYFSGRSEKRNIGGREMENLRR